MTTVEYESNVVLSSVDFNVVGTRPVRPDGADKVTGRALYGADFDTAGMLHGNILRSPHAHANIKSIDTSKAEALTGVLAIVTFADFPQVEDAALDLGEEVTTLHDLQANILARHKALYKGHAIAAVAATNPHVAEEAVKLIDVEYEVLPSIMTAPQGMAEGAAILHESMRTNELGETIEDKPSNVAQHFQHVKGDVDKGFADADVVVEREFDTVTVHQGYIEPHAASAIWNTDGRLHIWCSTQGAFTARDATAEVLHLPVSQVRVTPMEIGGGFGGKIPVYLEPVAGMLSKKSGRAVKIVMSRADVFEASGPTCGSNMKVKIGAKNDGTITAMQAYLAYEAGAFAGSPVGAGAMCVFAVYDVENAVIDGYDVVVNKPKTAAYRAPGAPNAAFACEQVVDELAQTLGMDPLDLRLKNAASEGTRRPDGMVFPRVGCVEVLEAMKNHPHYSAPLGENQGRGVAVGYWFNIGFDSAVNIAVNADGTITLIEGSTDIGGSRASISMQAAEVLGIAAESVRPTVVDTDSVGYTAVTGGSRTTYATGWAAYDAALDVKEKMITRAATIWDVDADSVELKDGVFQSISDPELNMSFAELAGQLASTGGSIVGAASGGYGGMGAGGGSFAGNIVDVEVDPQTGKTEVTRFTVVQDAGKAIHPSYVEGQMQGGSVQGIGWALNEEYYMTDDGTMANSTLLDYRMPTSLDLPMIDTVIVEVASDHPFGVRGVGEANIVPPTPAIANAVHSATGIRMERLPMSPVAIMEESWKQS